jgi:hypothetical protein
MTIFVHVTIFTRISKMVKSCVLKRQKIIHHLFFGKRKRGSTNLDRLYLEYPRLSAESMVRRGGCLTSFRTKHDSAMHYSHYFSHFFTFFNNNSHQNIFTFYITSIIFYYYSNKKLHYNTKLSLFYTNSFYFISQHHFLLFSKLTTHYFVMYKHLPDKAEVLTSMD